MKNFNLLLQKLSRFNLPVNSYMLVGGGVLAAYGLRDTSDLDIICSESLFNELAFKYGVTNKNDYSVIKLTNNIEVLGLGSVYLPNGFKTFELLKNTALKINNINIAPLQFIKDIKLILGREKDILDVQLIDEYLGLHTIL